jgi:hypothetical protein
MPPPTFDPYYKKYASNTTPYMGSNRTATGVLCQLNFVQFRFGGNIPVYFQPAHLDLIAF